ncbi:MAG: TRAP transporter large permease [Nitratireductor sp.]|uniref:TRAP transporter large permease n=1 Tax=Alphaproteobacteria TaxID=28211 RepID=UPI00326D40C4
MLAGAVTVLLLVLLALGTPVAFALLGAGTVGLWLKGGWPMMAGILASSPASAATGYELITIPMFLFMAELVILSGAAMRLFASAATWVGRLPGGLGIATTLAGAGFAAISGSSTASAATLASTTVPGMLRQGYEPKLACGVVAISGTLAMLIPPSIALILYGIVADVSIGKLLMAGIVPGILVTIVIALTVFVLVTINPESAPNARAYSMREKLASLPPVLPLVALFAAVTGLIYTGVVTPTEASAIGATGAFVLVCWERKFEARAIAAAISNAIRSTCMILMIILGAHVFGYFIVLTQVTQNLVAWVAALPVSPLTVLAIILAGLLVLGAFMDQAAIIVLTVPILLPIITALGYDPIWFGVIMVVTAEVGLVTPPIGLNAFIVARYTERPIGEVFQGVLPHVLAHVVIIAILVLVPALTLWLPATMQR